MGLELISSNRAFAGSQRIYSHQSQSTGTTMRLSVYLPPAADKGPVPVLWYLSGLTCTEENFTFKAGAQRYAAEHGLAIVAPDTSPRGANISGEDDSFDLGTGAGFYVNATQAPWSTHYNMYDYVSQELPQCLSELPLDMQRQGITGHSMGGHGAMILALKQPERFRSVSAFAPISAPSQCPFGQKAFTAYLGTDHKAWRAYDTCALLEDGYKFPDAPLVDQGGDDEFMSTQLLPDVLRQCCAQAGQAITLNIQPGYDHSYYFVATHMGAHIAHHAKRLTR